MPEAAKLTSRRHSTGIWMAVLIVVIVLSGLGLLICMHLRSSGLLPPRSLLAFRDEIRPHVDVESIRLYLKEQAMAGDGWIGGIVGRSRLAEHVAGACCRRPRLRYGLMR
jgi:hypothetical protein